MPPHSPPPPLPLIVACFDDLFVRQAHRPVRVGVALSVLVACEFFISVEVILLLTLFAVTVDLRGQVAPAPDRGRLVVANHRSTIDIAILLRAFGGRMVSREDLSGWPLLGAAARSVGTIFVDRDDAMSGGSDRWIRWTTTGCVALLALMARTVSYLHMHTLVALHGQPGWVSALTPLSVDGMIVGINRRYKRGSTRI